MSYDFYVHKTEKQVWPYADNLSQIRKSAGLSVERAAQRVAVVRSTWLAWEAGAEPRQENLKAIVEAFECPPDMVGYQAPTGWELVPTEWIQHNHQEVMSELAWIARKLGRRS
jgi:transcriptional regulator with XRE-family HTH domain